MEIISKSVLENADFDEKKSRYFFNQNPCLN